MNDVRATSPLFARLQRLSRPRGDAPAQTARPIQPGDPGASARLISGPLPSGPSLSAPTRGGVSTASPSQCELERYQCVAGDLVLVLGIDRSSSLQHDLGDSEISRDEALRNALAEMDSRLRDIKRIDIIEFPLAPGVAGNACTPSFPRSVAPGQIAVSPMHDGGTPLNLAVASMADHIEGLPEHENVVAALLTDGENNSCPTFPSLEDSFSRIRRSCTPIHTVSLEHRDPERSAPHPDQPSLAPLPPLSSQSKSPETDPSCWDEGCYFEAPNVEPLTRALNDIAAMLLAELCVS